MFPVYIAVFETPKERYIQTEIKYFILMIQTRSCLHDPHNSTCLITHTLITVSHPSQKNEERRSFCCFSEERTLYIKQTCYLQLCFCMNESWGTTTDFHPPFQYDIMSQSGVEIIMFRNGIQKERSLTY